MDKKVTLKVNPSHPNQQYRLGQHVIGATPAEYALNKAELAELQTAGPKQWIQIVTDEESSDEKTHAKKKKG